MPRSSAITSELAPSLLSISFNKCFNLDFRYKLRALFITENYYLVMIALKTAVSIENLTYNFSVGLSLSYLYKIKQTLPKRNHYSFVECWIVNGSHAVMQQDILKTTNSSTLNFNFQTSVLQLLNWWRWYKKV